MNKFVIGALATTVVGGTGLASESEWPELDRELEALSSTYQEQGTGGPNFGGWIIGAWDFSSDLTFTDADSGEEKDLSGVSLRSARVRAMGEVGQYGYKLEFDFFESEQSLFVRQAITGMSVEPDTGLFGDPSARILDAYAQVNVGDTLSVRLGNFRTPLLQSALIDRNRTLFVDRSVLGSVFANRTAGAMIYGDFEMVGWAVAVQNGDDGIADDYQFTGRVTVDLLGEGAGAMNEGAYSAGEETSLMLGAAITDDGSLDNGTVIAAEAYLASGPFSIAGEVADFDSDYGMLADATPWSATGSFMITEAYEIGLRYQDIDDTDNTSLISGVLAWYHDDWNTKWQLEYTTASSDNDALDSDVITLGLAVSF
jgi:hypothetical protein